MPIVANTVGGRTMFCNDNVFWWVSSDIRFRFINPKSVCNALQWLVSVYSVSVSHEEM